MKNSHRKEALQQTASQAKPSALSLSHTKEGLSLYAHSYYAYHSIYLSVPKDSYVGSFLSRRLLCHRER